MADEHDGGRPVVRSIPPTAPIVSIGGRARAVFAAAGRCRSGAGVRGGDRPLALQRRDRRRAGDGVGLGGRERTVRRRDVTASRGPGAACPRQRHLDGSRLERVARGLGDAAASSSGSAGARKAGPPGAQASVDRPSRPAHRGHTAGLPAGSEIVVGSVAGDRRRGLSATPRPIRAGSAARAARPPHGRPDTPRAPEPDVGGEVPGGPVRVAPRSRRSSRAGGYVFPCTARRRSATASAARGRTSPAVGTTARTSSRRRARRSSRSPTGRCTRSASTRSAATGSGCATTPGNEFYYAHLSAYSPLAVEGRRVEAGDVIGFVGDTGDAEEARRTSTSRSTRPRWRASATTASLRRTRSCSRGGGQTTSRSPPGGSTCPSRARADDAAAPGAVLLQADDIASTSGLVPGALERALHAKPHAAGAA